MCQEVQPNLKEASSILYDKAIAGDRSALGAILERAATKFLLILIYRNMSNRLRKRMTPEEALCEAFAYILGKYREGKYKPQGKQNFYSWAAKLTRHRIWDLNEEVKAKKRDVNREVHVHWSKGPGQSSFSPECLPAPNQPTPSEQAIGWELFERVNAAIDRLSSPYREVAIMKFLEGRSPGEIAAALNMKEQQVYTAIYRTKKKLCELLPDISPPEGGETEE